MSPSSALDQFPPPEDRPSNRELILWSLFLAGGGDDWVDVESVYLKAFDLAPTRFSWRTREDLPEYKKCAKALQELESTDSPLRMLLAKRSRYLRKLNMDGVAWCEKHQDVLTKKYSASVVAAPAIQASARKLREVERSNTYLRWASDPSVEFQRWELLEMLRCLPGTAQEVWMARCDEIQLAARRDGRTDIEDFIGRVRHALEQGGTT
jgi:hypothetical protein